MKQLTIFGALASAAMAASIVFGGGPAQAATTVKLSTPIPNVGSTFDVYTSPDSNGNPSVYQEDINYTFHWTISVAAGICSQTFIFDQDPIDGGTYTEVPLNSTTRSLSSYAEWTQYGPAKTSVVVHYCNGTDVTSNVTAPDFLVLSDDNGGYASRPVPAPSYFGAWSVSKCLCAEFGTTHYSTQKNASFSFRAAGVVGIIMAKAPNRGSAAVLVDGVQRAVINTYATKAINSTFVYSVALPGTATHTVTVKNLATPGHARIDVDAIVTVG